MNSPTQRILSQIQEAQKLSEGATPGPWKAGTPNFTCKIHKVPHPGPPECQYSFVGWHEGDYFGRFISSDSSQALLVDCHEDGPPIERVEDARFIAASRTLVPRLARQLEEAIKALEQASDIVHGEFCGRSGHHDCCEDVNAALSRIEQLGEEGK